MLIPRNYEMSAKQHATTPLPHQSGRMNQVASSGCINGEMEEFGGEKRFAVTWEGNEEYDQLSGNGWLKLEKKTELTGGIKFHSGDSPLFKAS
jgi:hypothetical protein